MLDIYFCHILFKNIAESSKCRIFKRQSIYSCLWMLSPWVNETFYYQCWICMWNKMHRCSTCQHPAQVFSSFCLKRIHAQKAIELMKRWQIIKGNQLNKENKERGKWIFNFAWFHVNKISMFHCNSKEDATKACCKAHSMKGQ